MGKTFRAQADVIEARYNELWAQADTEYEQNGVISQGTLDKLRDTELDMALLGI